MLRIWNLRKNTGHTYSQVYMFTDADMDACTPVHTRTQTHMRLMQSFIHCLTRSFSQCSHIDSTRVQAHSYTPFHTMYTPFSTRILTHILPTTPHTRTPSQMLLHRPTCLYTLNTLTYMPSNTSLHAYKPSYTPLTHTLCPSN